MPNVRTMPIMQVHNAKCADNAICAIYTMPFMHTMPIVHTMPFMQATQCQLCAQCQLCSTFGIVRLHIWHCVGAQLALCDVILYMHKLIPSCGYLDLVNNSNTTVLNILHVFEHAS